MNIAVAYLLNYIIVVFEHNYIENAINKTNGTVIIVNFSYLHYVFFLRYKGIRLAECHL